METFFEDPWSEYCTAELRRFFIIRTNNKTKLTVIYTNSFWIVYCRYLYTDDASFDLETATSLLPVARRFKVNRLVQLCLSLLHDGVDCDNVCILLDEAI